MSEISNRILNLITKKQVSYGDLSSMTGIPKSALQRYATGGTPKIPIDRIEKIAHALNVNSSYLMGWEDAEQNEIRPLHHPGDNIGRLLGKIYIQCDSDECTEDFFETYLDLNPDQRATVRRVTYSLAGRSKPVVAEKK